MGTAGLQRSCVLLYIGDMAGIGRSLKVKRNSYPTAAVPTSERLSCSNDDAPACLRTLIWISRRRYGSSRPGVRGGGGVRWEKVPGIRAWGRSNSLAGSIPRSCCTKHDAIGTRSGAVGRLRQARVRGHRLRLTDAARLYARTR